jgi:hypothetical protein
MKQTLLAVLLTFCSIAAFGQSNPNSDGTSLQPTYSIVKQAKLSIYPNPATDFISVNNADNVRQISIFNLVGRKLKSFNNVVEDQHYDVSDLPKGMYLVQVLDDANKIITTQRVSKR